MQTQQLISGHAFIGEGLEMRPVDIIIENGTISAIEEKTHAPFVWICPALFNAHTHLGDTVAMDCRATGDLTALVTPPHGLKHQILAKTSHEELVKAMHASIEGMIDRGTAGCADFREGGKKGVAALREAADGVPFKTCIFGRDGGELSCDGLGISSVRDVPDAEQQVAEARRNGKKIAFHAGERDAGDVDGALAFNPDLIIHATHATKRQIRECADRGIPIAICPRSNWTLGVTRSARNPPLRLMQELECTLMLGTDNVMFVPPDMFSEMAFTSSVYGIDPVSILRAAILGSGLSGSPFFIQKGARANFFTLDAIHSALRFSRDPVASLVKRAGSTRIGNNVFNL
jgi:cytosine/adenosine deaminase-related metal-dependent hydrolase